MSGELFAEPASDSRRTWVWAIPLLIIGLSLIGQLLVLLPADALGLINEQSIETYPTVLYLVIGAFAMMGLLFVLWIRCFERRSLASAGLIFSPRAGPQYMRGYVAGLLMGVAVVVAVVLAGAYYRESSNGLAVADLYPIVILMLAFALQAATEELVFRGWMLARFAARYGPGVGVVANSLLFTFMHVEFDTPGEASFAVLMLFTTMTFLFSVFLSLMVIREQSIWGACAWHAAWNWVFISFFALPTTGIELGLNPLVADLAPVAGKPDWLTGGIAGPEASIMAVMVLTLGCLLLGKRKPAASPV